MKKNKGKEALIAAFAAVLLVGSVIAQKALKEKFKSKANNDVFGEFVSCVGIERVLEPNNGDETIAFSQEELNFSTGVSVVKPVEIKETDALGKTTSKFYLPEGYTLSDGLGIKEIDIPCDVHVITEDDKYIFVKEADKKIENGEFVYSAKDGWILGDDGYCYLIVEKTEELGLSSKVTEDYYVTPIIDGKAILTINPLRTESGKNYLPNGWTLANGVGKLEIPTGSVTSGVVVYKSDGTIVRVVSTEKTLVRIK